MLKVSLSLSLAVLISFGATGCSVINAPSGYSTSSAEVSTNTSSEEKLRAETLKTLNSLQAISETRAYKSLEANFQNITIPEATNNYTPDFKRVLSKNRKVINEINAIARLGPGALESKDDSSKEFLEVYSAYQSVNIIQYGFISDLEESYGLTDKAFATDEDGKTYLKPKTVYVKDSNDAIHEFPDFYDYQIFVEDEGKKLVFDKPASANIEVVRDEVRSFGTDIERIRIENYRNSTSNTFGVEDNKLVAVPKGSPGTDGERTLTTDSGTIVELAGNEEYYRVTGHMEGAAQKSVYRLDPESGEDSYNLSSDDEANYDFEQFRPIKMSVPRDIQTLEEYVQYLNTSPQGGDAQYSLVEKNGAQYLKVDDPNANIPEDEILYCLPYKFA